MNRIYFWIFRFQVINSQLRNEFYVQFKSSDQISTARYFLSSSISFRPSTIPELGRVLVVTKRWEWCSIAEAVAPVQLICGSFRVNAGRGKVRELWGAVLMSERRSAATQITRLDNRILLWLRNTRKVRELQKSDYWFFSERTTCRMAVGSRRRQHGRRLDSAFGGDALIEIYYCVPSGQRRLKWPGPIAEKESVKLFLNSTRSWRNKWTIQLKCLQLYVHSSSCNMLYLNN